MPLTDTQIRKTKPREKTFRLHDGGGMYLEITPTGSRYWRLKYRAAGKEKRLALGVYPAITLAEARKKREGAKTMLANGMDPAEVRRGGKLAATLAATNSFEAVTREWFDRKHRREVVESHAARNLRRLEMYLLPPLGKRPIGEIMPGELLAALQKVENLGTVETARRLRTLAGQIFRYAIPSGRASRDIAADLRDALQTPKVRHYPAITDPAEVGPLLRALDGYQGQGMVVSAALRLAPMVFLRPGELRQARWAHLRLEAAEWDYQPSKRGLPMAIPLPRQAIELLLELRELTGEGVYLFPSARANNRIPERARPISNMTVNAALDRLGYRGRMRANGFRAMARTILAEQLNFPIEVIEMQLAHAVKDANGRAYNRTTFLSQRREMLQVWADYLDQLRGGTVPSPITPGHRLQG